MDEIYFQTLTAPAPADIREKILDIWQENTENGAAIGAKPGDPRSHYEELLAHHEDDMRAGKGWLYLMFDAETHELLGFSWWIIGIPEGHPDHIATIKRLQINPKYRGQGLGRKLMDHLHSPEVLADLGPDVEFLHLQFRAGLGLGKLYAKYGYEVNVRWDIVRKDDDGALAGWMEMIRRRNGEPLPEIQW